MTADGLPGGFHEAAAEVFRRSSSGPDRPGRTVFPAPGRTVFPAPGRIVRP